MDKYQIQIFGLQRSGTNFLHWTLNNNFILDEKIDYSISNSDIKGNIKGMAKYNQPQSMKPVPGSNEHKCLITMSAINAPSQTTASHTTTKNHKHINLYA